MDLSVYLAIALAVLALMLVGLGISGYVIKRHLSGQGRKADRLVAFLSRYVFVFGLLLGLEAFVLWLFPAVHLLFRDAVAVIVGGILELTGAEASVTGPLISVGTPSAVFDITVACLGGVLFWVFLALVLAEPRVPGIQRLKGILIGLGILFAFNIFRIVVSVYLEGSTGLPVHDYFYVINMLVVLLVWAGWARTLRSGPKTSGALA
jgi:exosortase/archaeosortase family protein